MLTLNTDIFLQIGTLLTDKEKIILTMICTQMDILKHKFRYQKKVHVHKILRLSYFNNFENVELYDINNRCPKHAKQIHFTTRVPIYPISYDAVRITHLTFGDEFNHPIKKKLPSSVTHLKFGDSFNKWSPNCIPSSVTHLEFGRRFNIPIQNMIPSSVKYLSFGDYFNYPIESGIPYGVTHLKFGYCFNRIIKNDIPLSVTHLEFGNFDQPFEDIPLSVTHLSFNNHHKPIKNNIPSSVTHLRFGELFRQNFDDLPPSVVEIMISKKYDLPTSDEIMSRIKIIRY